MLMSDGFGQQQGPSWQDKGAAGPELTHDADAHRLALEAIATLINVKKTAAEQLLRPAGVPDDLIRRFLTEPDQVTRERRSKREAGAAVLDELSRRGEDARVVRSLIAIAAKWNAFHLAQDEYKARAVVQKARELSGVLAEADARERLVLKQNPHKSLILMEGYDLRCVLARQVDLRDLMTAKLRALNLDSEPYFPVSRLMT